MCRALERILARLVRRVSATRVPDARRPAWPDGPSGRMGGTLGTWARARIRLGRRRETRMPAQRQRLGREHTSERHHDGHPNGSGGGDGARAGSATATPAQARPEAGLELDTAAIARYRRAVNYLAGAQIYLKSDFLLERPLTPDDIKDRLLGHWGTCPGINLVYAHLNRLIRLHDLDMFLVTGPGHGAPANLANLYLEGTLAEYYPELTRDRDGLGRFVKRFSWPGGFPSHLYPGIPGTIHEGGELGYALATAFGAAMDNPDLIVGCIVGDGEAETGPTATAWHSYKFIDPAEDGAVLPVVHINGYKIANPTIYGSMSDEELLSLFTGYGYAVQFVEGDDLDASLYGAMDWAYQEIRCIQQAA